METDLMSTFPGSDHRLQQSSTWCLSSTAKLGDCISLNKVTQSDILLCGQRAQHLLPIWPSSSTKSAHLTTARPLHYHIWLFTSAPCIRSAYYYYSALIALTSRHRPLASTTFICQNHTLPVAQ